MNRGWSTWVKVYCREKIVILNISLREKKLLEFGFKEDIFHEVEIRKMI